MSFISEGWQSRLKKFFKLHGFLLAAVLSYFVMTAYYMGPSITHCTDTVYGFGDNTAGPIWKYGLPGQTPLGTFENFTNYPFGESLYSPVNYSALLQSSTIWTLDKIAGPVCGYNLVNIIGFVSGALVMYGFIYWLTRNRWIALLSGYIVSFAPYFQYKVGGHPTYGYQALIIGALWLTFKVLKERRKRDAVGLGLLVGATFYWDPYFSLLLVAGLGPITVFWLVYQWWNGRRAAKTITASGAKPVKEAKVASAKKQSSYAGKKTVFKKQIGIAALAAGIAALVVLPLLALRFGQAAQINSYVGGARGNVMTDAIDCSILPWDYVLPADDNWFIGKFVAPSFSDKVRALRHLCNPSEYNVGLSYVVLFVVTVGLIIFAWEKLNRRKLFTSEIAAEYDYKFVTLAVLFMVVAVAILALPAMLGNFKFPYYYLLQITDSWRIPARLFIVVNIGMTVLFAIMLTYFAQIKLFTATRRRAFWLMLVILGLIFMQFQAFAPFKGSRSTFSYSKDVPDIYYWLKDQKDINFIASYPLDKVGESEAITHYVTVQRIHGKHLLTSTLPVSPQERLRYSIKDLTDPQTLPILRYLGVDALEIHGLTLEQLKKVPGITVIRYEKFVSPITGGYKAIAKINPGPKLDHAIVLEKKFPLNGLIMKSAIQIEFETEQNATMKVEDVKKDDQKADEPVCFQVKTADPKDEATTFEVKDGNKTMFGPIALTGDYQDVRFSAHEGQELTLHNSTSHNMRVNNVGCGE